MKKQFIIILLTLSSIVTYAQNEHINENRRIKQNLLLQECDYDGKEIAGKQIVPKTSSFQIVNETNTHYVINFWYWDKGNDNYKRLNVNESNGSFKYFLIEKAKLDVISDELFSKKWHTTAGAITYPVKYRPETGVFEKSLSLSGLVGFRKLLDKTNEHQSISILFGLGLSTITMDQYNTAAGSNITESIEASASTLSMNFVYQWNDVQIALTCGMDNKFNGNREGYIHQGKLWYGLGIGVNVFSNTSNAVRENNIAKLSRKERRLRRIADRSRMNLLKIKAKGKKKEVKTESKSE